MTEYKIRDLDNKIISSKNIKPLLPNKCPYCKKRLTVLDKRHLDHCQPYQEYLEKTKNNQKSIREFFYQINRQSIEIVLIHPNSWNINSMTQSEFEDLKENIRKTKGEYLKTKPIQIREIEQDYYEIIDGEHRWRACKELGYTHIPVVIENDIDIEKAKTLNVIYARNRGRENYFKFSKLLNEAYWIDIKEAEKNNWEYKKYRVKTTHENLAIRFGLSGKGLVSDILKIYPNLYKYKEKVQSTELFTNEHLRGLAQCKNDLLREKLINGAIEGAIEKKWTSEEIRKKAKDLNDFFNYLDDNFDEKTRDCILLQCSGNSLFELSCEELKEKIFHQFIEKNNLNIENNELKLILKYTRDFAMHSNLAKKYKEEYIEKRKKQGYKGRAQYKGWYNEYRKTPESRIASKMTYDFFQEYYDGKIQCSEEKLWNIRGCNKLIESFNDYIDHHGDYEFRDDMLWFIFLDINQQKIFPIHKGCHQPGNSKNWNKND